jgi:K+-transporting ATPase ATPase C chain
MKTMLRPAVALLLAMTVITGFVYPLIVTGIAQALFPRRANGSVIVDHRRPIGSRLIGQAFFAPRDFWGRPSATTPRPYDALASGGSNLGPSNPALEAAVRARIAALRAADPGNRMPVPVDLVTASASGLDPDISLAAAEYQAGRVARARGIPLATVRGFIAARAQRRWLGLFGEPRVNVLELNRALDAASATRRGAGRPDVSAAHGAPDG